MILTPYNIAVLERHLATHHANVAQALTTIPRFTETPPEIQNAPLELGASIPTFTIHYS